MECPVCSKMFSPSDIEEHVDMCLINANKTPCASSNKRYFPFASSDKTEVKRQKENDAEKPSNAGLMRERKVPNTKEHVPLAEKLRPVNLADYIGQKHMIGPNTILRQLLEKQEITSMILWGPPGCGKTSLANVIAKMSNNKENTGSNKFIKISATSAGINDIRDAVNVAVAEVKNGRRTIVFMDEIHRFNKLQQDIFLPHVEAGTFILIGATTENPSFSLNSALLSRCRVVSLEKLLPEDVIKILEKGLEKLGGKVVFDGTEGVKKGEVGIEKDALDWLAESCDGDARIALNSLDLAVKSIDSCMINLRDIKLNLERAYAVGEKKSDQNKNFVAALHKCIRDSHSNGALYWLARLMANGEDPVYIGKRLIRIASEEVSEDPDALDTAVHTMHGCQMIGMPECDVLLAQCVCYLCKSTKSRAVDSALRCVQKVIANHKGPQPSVPVFIRDTSSQRKLQMTIGKRLTRIEDHSRSHLPVDVETRDFFNEEENHDN